MGSPAGQKTQLLTADAHGIAQAAAILGSGGLVAMPTETVYGLAANALDPAAVERIFAAKGRPHWDPLIVHISDQAMLESITAHIPADAAKLIETFWPGPLTLLLPRAAHLPPAVTAGRDLVGVRMPAHPVARQLIAQTGLPLAAPSANRFGHISPTTAQHVLADLNSRIEAILDAGPCTIGVESTVLDPATMTLYRQGGISARQIQAATGRAVTIFQPKGEATEPASLPSPGVGIRHYAPSARMILVPDQQDLLRHKADQTTGIMLPLGWTPPPNATAIFHWESWQDPAALARTLYTGLRTLDQAGVQTILCPIPAPSEEPLVEAIRDRLQKSAREA